MKRLFSLLVMMLLLALPVYASDTNSALLERGYEQAYLDMLIEPQKEKLLELAEQYDANCVFVHSANGDRYTPDTVVAVAEIDNDTYLVAADYAWREVPASQGEDSFCVVWDEKLFEYYGGFAAYDWAQYPESGEWQMIRALDNAEVQPEGILYSVFPNPQATALRGSAYLLLTIRSDAALENVDFDSVKGGYFHNADENVQTEMHTYYKFKGIAIVAAVLLPFGILIGKSAFANFRAR